MIAIVVPSYNEKENMGKLIPFIFSLIKGVHIVVVDDSSPDGTGKVLKQLKKKYRNLHLIFREGKGGRGSAVMEGFAYAYRKLGADIFVEMDADFSHNPEELPMILKASKQKTVVIGSRYLKESRIVNWSLERKIMSRVSNLLIKLLLGLPAADNTNGYRCYRRDSIRLLIGNSFLSRGYMVLSESAYLLYKKGFRFVEIPTLFINRKSGKSNTTMGEFFNSLRNLIQIRMKQNVGVTSEVDSPRSGFP